MPFMAFHARMSTARPSVILGCTLFPLFLSPFRHSLPGTQSQARPFCFPGLCTRRRLRVCVCACLLVTCVFGRLTKFGSECDRRRACLQIEVNVVMERVNGGCLFYLRARTEIHLAE